MDLLSNMKVQLYNKILTLLEGPEKIQFSIYHDKSLEDADTVARLEAKIYNIDEALKTDRLRPTQAMIYVETRKMFKEILHGDKPNELT